MNQEQPASNNQGQSYYLFGIAVALLIFSTGKWILPFAAWLAPVFMLRFLRTTRDVCSRGWTISLPRNGS